jgi:hypothetical protein
VKPNRIRAIALATMALTAAIAQASSHREAPFITTSPKVDATDFYMFRSYEPAAAGYVTLIANYQPLQDAYGGPNYFAMDPNALYEIHIDNDGDAKRGHELPVPLQQHAGQAVTASACPSAARTWPFRWCRPARWPSCGTPT